MLQAIAREVFKRELVPPRARWWLAAAGMRDWFAYLRKRLQPHLGDQTEPLLAAAAHATFTRRLEDLARHHPHLEQAGERGPGLVFGALYRVASSPEAKWIFTASGGAPRSAREWMVASRLVAPMDGLARWREVTVHLGELLIVLTDSLPESLPHARKVLGDICFDAGVRYAKRMKRAWKLPAVPADAPALAIEVLRTSEYLFRVNPEHWGGTDAASNTGWLEGTACPWFDRPGWNGAHCGIFGQFQAGVSSKFGLRYILGKTIPKNGGTTCRIDLKPIQLRAKRA